MLRLRRYRVFLIFSVLAILVIYTFLTNPGWDARTIGNVESLKNFGQKLLPTSTAASNTAPTPHVEPGKDTSGSAGSAQADDVANAPPIDGPSPSKIIHEWSPMYEDAPGESPSASVVIQKGPGRKEGHDFGPDSPKIHWEKQEEHWPVSPQDIIKLPSGRAKAIPKIQYRFSDESSNDRIDRERRLAAVREAFNHSWSGYKEYAWGEDELRPVSGGATNPFNGWGATLVDALDTLYIMGLRSEFEEAVKLVEQIDFTTSLRQDIPLFETVIRYLGGLISAYDVSGGTFQILLDKAVELAEVLIGAFDTPNRMPITYYYWSPTFASQPHRASVRAVLAELGSLSLEFTRLAQLTNESKYYDAIARITNALEEWQDNTRLPGMWPISVDASGCKKPRVQSTKPLYTTDAEEATLKDASDKNVDERESTEKDVDEDTRDVDVGVTQSTDFEKRQLARPPNKQKLPERPTSDRWSVAPDDCEDQGLSSPLKSNSDRFTLGGMSDSVYEYLPKEYMLLGGLNPQYRTMYEKSVETVRKYLLFRPMVPSDREILMTGTIMSRTIEGETSFKLESGTGHLDCFAGGMFAIGAKIFNLDQDLDIASKLTDGCIWAYESTQTGIMPETFSVIPCEDSIDCPWNQTRWYDVLDPLWEVREGQRERQKEAMAKEAQKQKQEDQNLARDALIAEEDESVVDEMVPVEKSKRQLQGGEIVHGRIEPTRAIKSRFTPKPIPTHEEFVTAKIEEMRLPKGFIEISNRKYILRPEAIESVFIMYRITGDNYWREKGWKMFTAIQDHTGAEFGNSAIEDVTSAAPALKDKMESFWLAETLKYFYLLYSDPNLVSLDEYVLNTEAHPFKRPKSGLFG